MHVSPFIDHHVIKENYFDTPVFCALIRLFESSISLFLNTNTNQYCKFMLFSLLYVHVDDRREYSKHQHWDGASNVSTSPLMIRIVRQDWILAVFFKEKKQLQ